MTPETWEKVKVLYEAALERPSEQRIRYLMEVCSQDDLRSEVIRLLANFEEAGSFLSQSLLAGMDSLTTKSEAGFLPSGQVLAGRFKLKRFIARGGMGEVYEAEDLELQERVALKLVRPELLLDGHAMQRFKREVQLAKKVTHPNVCRTFDLFRHHDVNGDAARDLIFVSMELLAGETLSQNLGRRGRLSPAEALPLTTQIAGGMEAAHKVGVIHRDFKPGNIILVPEGTTSLRAVVTDFGLALRSGGDGTTVEMSASHGIVGTPAYMAPEQIAGREVTTATDIYAFGLVLYEMLTGSLPFASETPLGKAARRLHEPIPSPRTIVPDFDPSWEGVILRCLERDPDKRFASISELRLALTERESAGERKQKAASEKLYRRILAFAVLLVFALGITIYATRARNAERTALSGSGYAGSSSIKIRPAVAVLGFRNVSKRSDKDWLSESLTEALNSELSEGAQLRLVSGESVARMKMDLSLPDSDSYAATTLHQIRQNSAADYVIQGSFLDLGDQTGGQIRVDARVQDARSGETVDSVIENGNETDLNGLLVKTGADLRQKLKINAPSPKEQTQSRAALPSNLEAARHYADGLQKLRAFDSLGARDSLEMAVEKEPTFALAHSALAAAWANLGYDAKARDSAKKAVELSASLDNENRQWIEAQYYEVGHEQAKALAAFQSLFSLHPDNLEYGLRLLAAMVRGGQSKNAQSIVDALRGLPAPAANDPRIDLLSANAAFVSGDYKQSVILAKAAETKAESAGAKLTLALALMRQGAALMYLGQKKEAMELDEKALRIFAEAGDRDDVAKINANLGAVLNSDANFAEGMKRQKESLEEFRRIGDRRGETVVLSQLGWDAQAQDRLDEAQTWFEQALLIDRELGGNGAGMIGKLAEISHYKGDLSGATLKNEQVLAIAKESGNLTLESDTLNNLIDLYITRGDLATARELLAKANAIFAKTGAKRGTAMALGSWGRILMAENNIVGARQKYEESLKILTQNDGKPLLPYFQMSLATLEIEQGLTSDAEALLKEVMNYFHSQKNSADEGWAMGIYARAELESGNIASAQQKAEKAKALCAHDQTLSSVGVRLFAARVEGLTGHRKAAETELRDFLKVAERQGNVELAFDARFALGETALKSKDPEGKKILSDLAKDAEAKGFLLVSQKADSLLSNHLTP